MKKKMIDLNTAFGETNYLEAMLSLLVERTMLNHIINDVGKVVKRDINDHRECIVNVVKYFMESAEKSSKIVVHRNGHEDSDIVAEYPSWDVCAPLRDFPNLTVEDIYDRGFCCSTADGEFFIVRAV